VTAPKYVGAVLMLILMWILKLFLREFTYASDGKYKNFNNIKMQQHGMCGEKIFIYVFYYMHLNTFFWRARRFHQPLKGVRGTYNFKISCHKDTLGGLVV
jgi:hypothetical protein